ncbi:FAD-dependent oxidoreductase [Rhodopirellula halodulae]|uniref:FAD-dependent oxidoreductase n=1 Tax=Rhodopirellula halodulae TaxID=2894198 RepID=UPI001E321206|nr:FAD-dependent oxidoreductase [Rhodopirellula sp. JC737]MCC9656282.1 FAD-dependent oxidoreductase [Rhodopirellula sp. JC737]
MSSSRRQLVLLGIGHTNAHVVRQWQSDPIPNCDLVCISKFPTATYSGMLPGTLGNQFNDAEWRIDLSTLCERAGAKLILAATNGLDLDMGLVKFESHESVRFDALSIGVGSMPAGWSEHADQPSMVPIKPMQTFLQRLDTRLTERPIADGRPMQIAIVGGGVASVEIAFCLLQRLRSRFETYPFSITIYTSDSSVAGGMTAASVRKIERLLSTRGIQVVPNQRVTNVAEANLVLENGQTHLADVVIWATGATAPPVLKKLGLEWDDRGFVATSDTLQSLTDPRIFAVGDAGTILESPAPKAGVYAVRQSPILSHNLRAFFANESMQRFEPQSNFLKLLNTGDGKALLEYGRITVHAKWCWYLKNWIDQRFIRQFQESQQESRIQ